jgi:hypothetical protein
MLCGVGRPLINGCSFGATTYAARGDSLFSMFSVIMKIEKVHSEQDSFNCYYQKMAFLAQNN